MLTLYFLHSEKDDGWYIGQTSLIPEERLQRHNAGFVRSTKYRRPFVLAYIEEYQTRAEAMKREWYLKHPIGYKEKLQIIQDIQMHKESWPRRGPFGPRAYAGPKGDFPSGHEAADPKGDL